MPRSYYVYGGNLLDREKYTSVVRTTFGDRRYFSSIDTDVYFGDYHVNEMVAFDFIIEEQKMPIFGYNNFTAKRLITGRKNIQGSFAINFTRTFDMQQILDSIADSLYANAYEETEFYCADDNKALFGKGFDITLSYGEAKAEGSYNACTQTLVGCYITSYRQAFDTSGEPILDMYTFIAKDLISVAQSNEETIEEETQTDTDNETTTEPLSPEAYKLYNEYVADENGQALIYYNEHKDDEPEPLCISINPAYTHVDGVSKLTTPVLVHNTDLDVKYNTFKIVITDQALKLGGYAYNLEPDGGDHYFTFSMTGNQVNAGKQIKKYFEDPDNDTLECEVHISCSVKDTSYDIVKKTVLHN